MAGRKSPGMAPLGHSPFGKEKLEGIKKHHENHGKDASVPGKKPIGEEHWERMYSTNDPSKNMYLTEGSDFMPKRGCDRKTTHLKVNELDH